MTVDCTVRQHAIPAIWIGVALRARRWANARVGWTLCCALVLQFGLVAAASAQTRAWLDRDRIGAGETVTLNVETTQSGNPTPDFAPLQRDFVVSGNTSRREFVVRNGRTTVRALYGVALRPRRDGVLTVPALAVGAARTSPLTLVVSAASARIPAPTRAGDNVFIESEPDDETPYVQQAVGWVVRLYSAVPLVSGQLDQPAPDGATLQRVGEDAQYTRDFGGRRYMVVERRYLLLPERSGTLTLPGAVFEGRGTGGFFDDLFGDRGGVLKAQARPRFLQVQAPPATAPQPWLPLHALELRYRAAPGVLRVGEATDLVVEISADGATAAQMPEVRLPTIDGVQVFAEPVKSDEGFAGGRPRVKQLQRFSLVPARPGAVHVPALKLAWWDVRSGSTRVASLPPLQLNASPASAARASSPAPATAKDPANALLPPVPGDSDGATWRGLRNPWVVATVVFAALWLLTLLWWLSHRGGRAGAAGRPAGDAGTTRIPPAAANTLSANPDVLRRALDTGSLGDVAEALLARGIAPHEAFPDMHGIFIAAEGYPLEWAAKIEEHWEPQVKEMWAANQENIRQSLIAQFGEQGIDHALYRAWGCDAPWRGDGNATLPMTNDVSGCGHNASADFQKCFKSLRLGYGEHKESCETRPRLDHWTSNTMRQTVSRTPNEIEC